MLLAQNIATPPANTPASSDVQTPLSQPTPLQPNVPPVQTLPAPNIPVGAEPPRPPAKPVSPLAQLRQGQAQIDQSLNALGQSVNGLGDSVDALDERTTQLEQEAETAQQYEQKVDSIVETGRTIEQERDRRAAQYERAIFDLAAIDQALLAGNTEQLPRIQALEQELVGLSASAAATSGQLEQFHIGDSYGFLRMAESDLLGGDYFVTRTDLTYVQNGLYAARQAATGDANALWRHE